MSGRSHKRLPFLLAVTLILPYTAAFALADESSATGPPLPLNVVLVLDRSGSMGEKDARLRLIDSVAALVANLPRASRLAAVVFNHQAQEVVPLTSLAESDLRDLVSAIESSLVPEGGTDILAAVGTALELLAEEDGGRIVLLSDGLQSGTGTEPAPESVWGGPAQVLLRQARTQQVVIHAIGLGSVVAADPLLQRLAADTGGSFHPVRQPQDLLSEYIGLASRLGKYWRCSEPSQFTVAEPTEVIQVVPADAPQQLFRDTGGQLVPLDAVVSLQYGAIRAERFPLSPGRYVFRPEGQGPADLLRPLDVILELATPRLPAARSAQLGLTLKPLEASAGDSAEISVSARICFGREDSQPARRLSPTQDGQYATTVKTSNAVGPFTVVAGLQQQAWRYRSEPLYGQTTTPDPIDVKVSGALDDSGRLALVTREPVRSADFELTFEAETYDHGVEVLCSSTSPEIEVVPSRIRLAGGRQVVPLTLKGDAGTVPAALRTGQLRFQVQTDDLVPATIHGQPQLTWDFRWQHRRPRLQLQLATGSDPIKTDRAQSILIPAKLTGEDLDGEVGGVRLQPTALPAGIDLAWQDSEDDGADMLATLTANAKNASLRVSVGNSVMPGDYFLEFDVQSPDPSIPLDGTCQARSFRLPLVVSPVDVQVWLPEAPARWSVVAPCERQTCQVRIAVATADGGPLPACEWKAVPSPPSAFRISPLRQDNPTPDVMQAVCELEIPAQSPPFAGTLCIQASGPQVECRQEARLAVVVRPAVVDVTSDGVQLPRYSLFGVPLFDWLQPQPLVALQVRFQGGDVRAASPSWHLVTTGPDGAERVVNPDPGGGYRLNATASYVVVLKSPYGPTEFQHPGLQPANRLRLQVQQRMIPVAEAPWSPWLLLPAGLVFVAGVFAVRPIKIALDDAIVLGWFGRLRLGRVLRRPGLRVTLTRHRLKRHPRDSSPDKLVLESQVNGREEIRPGGRVPLYAGDVLRLVTPDGEQHTVHALSGPSPPVSVSEFMDQH